MARKPTPSHQARSFPTSAVLAAIDVGTNAVRLEIVKPLPNGSFEILHQERDPLRPGEGVFRTGAISKPVSDRLLSTLRRYAALCRRFHATVRAVATSAVREAKNREDIVRRTRREAGLELEVVSGREEARLIALGVCHGFPANQRSLVIDVGGGSTELATAVGERPEHLYSVAVGAVRLTELFTSSGRLNRERLTLIRSFAEEAFQEAVPRKNPGRPAREHGALGSSGTIQTVVGFAAAQGTAHATLIQVERAVARLAELSLAQRRKRFDARRAEIVTAGAVILEAVMRHLGLRSIASVQRGLRDGLIVDLMARKRPNPRDHSLGDAALALGRRFQLDERHARQVARLALALFDDLASLHKLPASTRPLLEVAGLLHDVGNAISYQRHHKHSYYLIQNADIPGLTERERELSARLARFHRRSSPERSHIGTAGLSDAELQTVRSSPRCCDSPDSFDRSHHQPVRGLRAFAGTRVGGVVVLSAKGPLDLELGDARGELGGFLEGVWEGGER